MKKSHQIKWILFHAPVEIFVRTAEAFAQEIGQLTDGRITIEVYKEEEYAKKFNEDVFVDPVVLLKSNAVQMSQIQTNWLGHINVTDFYALDMPFLFKSHDHCSRVLEGPIGESMLASIPEITQAMRGLAFTYSGGYRCIASREPITSVDGFHGISFAVRTNPVLRDMAKAFGSDPAVLDDLAIEGRKDMSRNHDVVQTTLPRYEAQIDSSVHPYVINTRHNMFLTTILVNEQFWQELDIEDQILMKKAAISASRQERQWSIDDAKKIETQAEEQKRLGIKEVLEFPETEREKLREMSKALYKKYDDVFSPGFLNSIINS
jgi:TRAP-type C4-dicarboxylate transport system substrate-binding protein